MIWLLSVAIHCVELDCSSSLSRNTRGRWKVSHYERKIGARVDIKKDVVRGANEITAMEWRS